MKKEINKEKYTSILHPYPTTLITTMGKDRKPNIIAIAWISPLSVNPPVLMFAIRRERYSFKLLTENEEFVVNIPSFDLKEDALICGTYSGKDKDKFEITKFTMEESKEVSVPSIKECIGHIECKVLEIIDKKELDHVIVLGSVLRTRVNDEYFEKHWQLEKVNLLLHVGGNLFTTNKNEIKKVKI
jgi:flavin reductase (DIM6/NTAB) family NADH-FMN oxidoreductase RutF